MSKRLNIAFLQRELPSTKFGGVANQVHILACELIKEGHFVTIFTLSEYSKEFPYKVVTLKFNYTGIFSKFLYKHFLSYLYSKQDFSSFDIIHSHGDNFLVRNKIPQIRTYYGSAIKEALSAKTIKRFFSQMLFYLFECIGFFNANINCIISPITEKYLPGSATLVPCGIDTNIFKETTNKTKFPSIIFMGELKSRKNGLSMLELFKEINSSIPDAQLFMISPDYLKTKNVKFFKNISNTELASLLSSSWLFVSLSSYEGFGLPALEAMSCSTTVASVKNDGWDFLSNDNCLSITLDNKYDSKTIIEYLTNKDRHNLLNETSYIRAQNFSIKKTANTYIKLYEKLIFNKNE